MFLSFAPLMMNTGHSTFSMCVQVGGRISDCRLNRMREQPSNGHHTDDRDENQNRASCDDSFHQHIASDGVLSGSGKLVCAGRMNIAKEQHVFESILAPSLITASAFECLRIFERAKEHVP
jgi:hypothetical protein